MRIERSRNTRRNFVYGVINRCIGLLLPFFVRTIFIKKIGIEYLGLNSLFSSILQVLNLADLGIGNAIVFSLYKPLAEDDKETICALMNYYKHAYRVIGILIMFAGLLLLPFLTNMINGTPPADINIFVVYLIFLVNTCITYLMFGYKQALPLAMQRMDVISNISSISTILLNAVQVLVMFSISNYYAYIIVLPLTSAFNNVITSYYVDRIYPEYKARGKISTGKRKDIKKRIRGLMITKICGTTRNTFDSIFLSAFLGLTITAMYNNYYYIVSCLTSVMIVITSAMTSGVGNSIVKESVNKNYLDLRRMNFIYMTLSGWCMIFMLSLYQPFMELWVGKELCFPYSVVIMLCIYFYILKLGDIRSMYLDGAGIWWETRWQMIGETGCNIVLNFFLVMICEVHGIILATIISLLIFEFGVGTFIVFKNYFKNGKLREYYKDNFIFISVTTIVAFLTVCLCEFVPGSTLTRLICRGAICCILPIILYLLFYCKTKLYYDAISWLLPRIKMERRLGFLIRLARKNDQI